ncbi:hypothetical protein ACFL6W_10635 [Thermodesulfobacteriota bacterium]
MSNGHLTVYDILELRKRMSEISQDAMNDRQAVISLYPSFNSEIDIRISSIGRLLTTFNATVLSLTLMNKYLMSSDWWYKNINSSYTDSEIIKYVAGYSWAHRASLIYNTFACIESSFRIMLRAIDPSACSNALGSFKSVYDYLLNSKLSCCPNEGIEFLDLFRLLRNTVHNNGVYFHRSGRDETVHWQGNDYEFRQEIPVDFVNWSFCITIANESRKLLKTVVENPILREIDQEITDPFAFHIQGNL